MAKANAKKKLQFWGTGRRKKAIARVRLIPSGTGAIVINAGAAEAIGRSKGVSILPVGVVGVEGRFEKDDIVRIVSPDGVAIGVGRVAVDSGEARALVGRRGAKALIHYDYLYIE